MIEDLAKLGQNALQWAKAYTNVTEALMTQGVPEELARAEARDAANFALFYDPDLFFEDYEPPDGF